MIHILRLKGQHLGNISPRVLNYHSKNRWGLPLLAFPAEPTARLTNKAVMQLNGVFCGYAFTRAGQPAKPHPHPELQKIERDLAKFLVCREEFGQRPLWRHLVPCKSPKISHCSNLWGSNWFLLVLTFLGGGRYDLVFVKVQLSKTCDSKKPTSRDMAG